MKTEKPKITPRDVITEPVRLAFHALTEMKPKMSKDPNSPLAYQAVLLIPEGADLKPYKTAMKAALIETFGEVPAKMDRQKLPLKTADDVTEPFEGLEPGWHFVRATSGFQPALVDGKNRPVINPKVFYSGCWVRAHLRTFTWNNAGGKGVSFGLEALQFHHDDKPFSNRPSPKDIFSPVGDVSDDGDGDDDDDLFA